MSRYSFAGSLAMVALTAVPLPAQTEDIQEEVAEVLRLVRSRSTPEEPRRLLLTPAPLPSPVLRFALLPELRDQTPGDGGPLFLKAGEKIGQLASAQEAKRGGREWFEQWSLPPLPPLPRDELRPVLEIYKEPLALLDKAARFEKHSSDLTERLRQHGLDTLLPEVDHLRLASLVLLARARLELADNQPDRALRTLQTCYVLGHFLGESAGLVSLLAGAVITTRTNNVLEEVLTHPQAPNLAWSLASLPRPFLSLRTPLEGIRLALYANFPESLAVARDPQAGPLSAEQAQKLVGAVLRAQGKPDNPLERYRLAQAVRDRHEAAKRALIATGRPKAKVDSWPHLQVAVMHALLEFDQVLDEARKWQQLPYWQAEAGLEQFDRQVRRLRQQGPDSPALPLTDFLLPSVRKLFRAQANLERQFIALRHLEALRLYAARHGGKLPASLDDVKEVPLPSCPATGKPFAYRQDGNRAVLTAPDVPGPARGILQPLSYEVTLRR